MVFSPSTNRSKNPDTGLIGFTVSASVGNLTGRDHLHDIQSKEARKVRSIPVGWVYSRSLTTLIRLSESGIACALG